MAHSDFVVCIWEPVFRFLNLPFPTPSLFLLPWQPDSLSTLELKQELYAWNPLLYNKYMRKERDSPLGFAKLIIATVNYICIKVLEYFYLKR